MDLNSIQDIINTYLTNPSFVANLEYLFIV